jgi:UDP-N-acetylglucosamine--dolichyl-phosphate N-acetylglucosaminephosphotransferase
MMVWSVLFTSLIISWGISLIFLPLWIKKAKKIGFLWEDMNKYNHPKNVASSGGIVVIIAFVLGVLFYVAIRTFILKIPDGVNLEIFALLSVILILSIVGIIDDWFGWRHKGLPIKFRLILAFVASIPLVVINAGISTMNLPFLGPVNLGILYPLLLIPVGIAGATTTYNFLAGFNGLEAGQGILILSFLSFVAYKTGSSWLALIGLIMVTALLGFYFYNKYPAKVFPGDSMTWALGALIAGMAILGNFEKVAVFVFIPYIIETALKSRGKLKKESFAKPNKDGSLEMPYEKIYGLEHLSVYILKKIKPSKKVYEKDVVYLIHSFQILIILFAFLIFFN